MKISPHFDIREFVDPVTYAARGVQSIGIIDIRIVNCVELLRVLTGRAVTVNNYHVGGQYHESGTRHMDTATGVNYSQHKFGRASDVKVEGMTPTAVRAFIKDHWAEFKAAGLTTIEKDTPTWTHMDCRYTGMEFLYEVPYR
jgi:hypothetical protein